MPRYDIQCDVCNKITEIRLTYSQYDVTRDNQLVSECEQCHMIQTHHFYISKMPAVEYAVDGFRTFDDADPTTKYQRNHLSRSGDNNDKRLRDRRKRRSDREIE